MAEFRKDLRGERMIISPGRAARPYDFRSDRAQRRQRCPFCPGRESETPPEVDAVRPNGGPPNSGGWSLRVVPNLFPAFPRDPDGEGDGEREPAYGVHEVIIETPDHDRSLEDLSGAERNAVLEVWRRRLLAARQDPRMRYACLFKNRGESAGASLEHAHSQLMALPYVPQRIQAETEAAQRGALQAKLATDSKSDLHVLSMERVGAFAAPDARFPFEVWLAPRKPEPSFEESSPQTIAAAAEAIGALLGAFRRLLNSPDYHLIVYTAPFGAAGEGYRWRVEIFPRLTKVAGFEWATGVFVNQADPADAARQLRQSLADGS